MNPTQDTSADLAAQLRAELSDRAPEGFHFSDHVIRQDAGLEQLTTRLREHGDDREVALALGRAVSEERDGWTLLKLLELTERLGLTGTAPALLELARRPPGDDLRSRFLAGRACEVMLKLPLDYETRIAANEVCKQPLADIARFRMGAAKERAIHRPRKLEWAILVGLMVVGLAGFLFALLALGH